MLSPISNVVGHAQLCIGIDCCPRPNVAPALCLLLGSHVLFLRPDKLPDFITLQAADPHIAHVTVMIISAHLSQVDQESHDCILSDSGYAHRGTDAVPFTK